MITKSIKRNIPYFLKNSLKTIYAYIPLRYRFNKNFRKTYNFSNASQWWSKKDLEEFQMQQLRKLLIHAYENVPYYRNIFNERGLKPIDIKDINDLKKLPYLTKDIIRKNLHNLIARNYSKRKLQYVTTSGSTGRPLGLYLEKGITDVKEWAFIWRQWNWAGLKLGAKRVIIRGDVIVRYKNNNRQLWEFDPLSNTLILSSYDLNDKNLPKYINKINKFKPDAIQGYPSNLYILSNYIKNNKLTINNIKCILTASENLYPFQRNIIQRYLGAKIFDLYGNTERSCLIMECEKNSYHPISEFGIIEIIGKDNKPVYVEDQVGEIVATGFNNYGMPLIRYRTMDMVLITLEKCKCGRNYPLVKRIEGRLQEYIQAKDGSIVSLAPAIFGIHDVELTKIKQLQFFQKEQGKLIIQGIRCPSFSATEVKEYILNLFKARFEGNFDLEVKLVDEISRTRTGKYRFLIQKLPIELIRNDNAI